MGTTVVIVVVVVMVWVVLRGRAKEFRTIHVGVAGGQIVKVATGHEQVQVGQLLRCIGLEGALCRFVFAIGSAKGNEFISEMDSAPVTIENNSKSVGDIVTSVSTHISIKRALSDSSTLAH